MWIKNIGNIDYWCELKLYTSEANSFSKSAASGSTGMYDGNTQLSYDVFDTTLSHIRVQKASVRAGGRYIDITFQNNDTSSRTLNIKYFAELRW